MQVRRLRIPGTTLLGVFILLQHVVLGQGTYTLDRRDAVLIGIAGGGALIPMLAHVEKSCLCSISGLNRIDRGTALRRSETLNAASYVVAASAIALPVTLSALDSKSWSDPVVIGEALLVNTAVNQIVKYSVQRPRPLLYGLSPNDSKISDPDNHLSFYSQHTSSVFATGMSYARTFAFRHPQSRYRWAVYSAVGITGATVGWMRDRCKGELRSRLIYKSHRLVRGPWFHCAYRLINNRRSVSLVLDTGEGQRIPLRAKEGTSSFPPVVPDARVQRTTCG